MPARSCGVTIRDMDGIAHTVEVTAAALYEAMAQGLAGLRGNEWVASIAQGCRKGFRRRRSRRARSPAGGFHEIPFAIFSPCFVEVRILPTWT